jgi:hypothetical protein
MSTQIFNLKKGTDFRVGSSIAWKYSYDGTVLKFYGGRHSLVINFPDAEGEQVGFIADGAQSRFFTVKRPRDPRKAIMWEHRFPLRCEAGSAEDLIAQLNAIWNAEIEKLERSSYTGSSWLRGMGRNFFLRQFEKLAREDGAVRWSYNPQHCRLTAYVQDGDVKFLAIDQPANKGACRNRGMRGYYIAPDASLAMITEAMKT